MKTLALFDMHFPYQDNRAINCALEAGLAFDVAQIVLGGDINDCTSASLKFHDQPKDRRNRSIDWELSVTGKFIGTLRELFGPKTPIIVMEGNHESRIERSLRERLPALSQCTGYRDMLVKFTPKLDQIVSQWLTYGEVLPLGTGLCVTHGDVVRRESGQSAKAMLDKWGRSVVFGHTHRLGAYYRRYGTTQLASYEGGCLCRLDQPYLHGPANWQQGFNIIWSSPSDYNVQQFRVDDKGRWFHPDADRPAAPQSNYVGDLPRARV